MKDKYIDGVSISKLDDEITKIVTKCNDSELGGMPMLIAIQNEDGLVYRVLTTFGLGSYMEIVYAIADLGLKDLYANNINPQKYDSLFVHK